MFLVFVLFVLILVGLVGVSLAIAVGGKGWPLLSCFVARGGLFVFLVCFLGLATLLLPSPSSWLMTIAGVAAITVIVTRQTSQVTLLGILLLAVCAGFVFYLIFTVFEVTMSSRAFEADRDFLAAAFDRSVSAESLEFLLSIQVPLCCGVVVGRLLSSILRDHAA